MSLNLFIPQLEGGSPESGKARVKDYVVSILGKSWPHTVRELYWMIRKQHAYSVTYQAVYKAMKELESTGVIIRSEENTNGYQIDVRWIERLHGYTEIVQSNYYTKNRLRLIEGIKEARSEGNINILTFESMFDVEKYIYYLQKDFVKNSGSKGKKKVICVHHNNEWRPLFYLRAEYNWVRKLIGGGYSTYVLCAGNTLLDKWCAGFYRKIGCSIKLGVNCANMCELMVFGDYVIQIYVPMDLKENLQAGLEKARSIEDVDIHALFTNVFEAKKDIQVVVNRDEKLAQQLRDETMKHFKKRKK